ncbi:MAG: zinc ABC transporter substrate-binding protein [Rhodobacteraceae bacterium]|nr:zinc ABC transporter substrate-binding protein [Paracoccaceae bacterium]
MKLRPRRAAVRLALCLMVLLPASALKAQNISTTITPLAGLVQDLMAGIAPDAPTLLPLVPANTEPHNFSLKPSQLAGLRRAELVVAVGQDMEPWLARAEGGLPAGRVIQLGELPEVAALLLAARGFDGQAKAGIDPHMWLDPEIMSLWAQAIAPRLAELSPESAPLVAQNLAGLLAGLERVSATLRQRGDEANLRGVRFVSTHDAYQYMERRMGLDFAGTLADIGGNRAGARSLSAISRLEGPVCLLVDPNESEIPNILPQATRVVIDPLGAQYLLDTEFTLRFYQGMTEAIEACL